VIVTLGSECFPLVVLPHGGKKSIEEKVINRWNSRIKNGCL
jgi:hypothetical protein